MPSTRPSPLRTSPIRAAATVAAAAAAAGTGLGALSLAAGPALVAGAAAPTQSAQAEYKAAVAAVAKQGVHFTSNAVQNGIRLQIAGDTGETSGSQDITIHRGSAVEHMTATVVGSTGYVNGNNAALHDIIGLTSAQSSKYAGKWLSFPTSSSLGTLVSGLLNKDVASELAISGPYSYGKATTLQGQHAITIKGTVNADGGGTVPVVLYVTASGKPMPIQEVTNPGKTGSSISGAVTFSHWGEGTSETAPAHTVSLLKLVPASSGATSTTAG
jgi:hypothetical protein